MNYNKSFTTATVVHDMCPFNPMEAIKEGKGSWVTFIMIYAFTLLANIIPNLYAIYAMIYVLRRVNSVDNATLVNWTKGTVILLGIRALPSLPLEITLMLRPQFGLSVSIYHYFIMRDLKGILTFLDPFIFGLRLPDFKRFLCGAQVAGNHV